MSKEGMTMLILASQSPRRREMLDRLGLDYLATSADTDETVTEQVSPDEYVRILAKRKGEAVLAFYTDKDFVLSADTVVALDGEIFGKVRKECGNYMNLDLNAAKAECKRYLEDLKRNPKRFDYPTE